MKLRFYLRGLGVGILVTAMIFCLLPSEKGTMSDAEIKARALKLGMVESSSLTLGDIGEAEPIEPEAAEPESVESESVPEGTVEADMYEIFEGATEVLKITIESGANSYTVSKQLEERLLVEDAGEFDEYLCSHGYSRNIRVGTHEIPVDATWEEIAKIISGK